jgi:hypothetical protein
MPSAASSAVSEREERVFTAAIGLMDSSQEGEAVAAFLRARGILQGRGSGFRPLIERCEEADRRNDELGRQNADLRRENAALRARDTRPAGALSFGRSMPRTHRDLRWSNLHWDLGLMIIIAVWAAFGLLGAATAFTLAAAVLICAAFTHWFSPLRFAAGVVLALAAYATSAYAVNRAPEHPAPDAIVLPAAAGPPPSPRALAAPRASRAALTDCGWYRLMPGFDCAQGHQWRRDSSPDFDASHGMHSD